MPDMTPAEMERRLADLWAAFDEAGGRGVELAEEIDRLQAALDRHEASWFYDNNNDDNDNDNQTGDDMAFERTAWLCHVAFQSHMHCHMGDALEACLDAVVTEGLAHWVKHPDTAGELPVGEVAYLNGMNIAERQFVRAQATSLLGAAVKASDNFNK